MTHLKAREWIKPLRCRRGELDSTAKEIQQAMWDRVGWEIERSTTGLECYPSRELLAEDTGHTVEVVAKAIRRLTSLGWVRRDRGGWALAWREPFSAHGTESPRILKHPDTRVSERRIPESPDSDTRVTGNGYPSPPEPRTSELSQGTKQPDAQSPAPQPTDHDQERAVIAMLIELNVAGSNPGPSFVAPMLERMRLDGCSLDQVRKIVVEWKRRRDSGDKGLARLQSLFYSGSWWRTRVEYLGERPPDRASASRARAGTPSISDAWAEYDATNG